MDHGKRNPGRIKGVGGGGEIGGVEVSAGKGDTGSIHRALGLRALIGGAARQSGGRVGSPFCADDFVAEFLGPKSL